MEQSRCGAGDRAELGLCAWIGFWAQLVVLGVLAVLGAFFASDNSAPGDYACGLGLSLAALALAFMRREKPLRWRRRRLGGFPAGRRFAQPRGGDRRLCGAWAGVASWSLPGVSHGGLHDGGVALFVASGLAVFLSLKHVFDNLDRQP